RRNRGDARRLRGSDDRCRAVGLEEIPPPTRRGQGRWAATRLAAVSRPTRAACAETLAWARDDMPPVRFLPLPIFDSSVAPSVGEFLEPTIVPDKIHPSAADARDGADNAGNGVGD